MDNFQIADTFSLLAKLMDIHGENSFKSKSYASAAFAIEKLPAPLAGIAADKMAGLKGIGASSAQKIQEILQTGKLQALEDLVAKTPPGVLEMLNIKGIGPKKIHTIWKEMEIETIGELLYACKENRLKLYKGFGDKTQQNVIDTIEFYFKNKGSHLYAQVALIAEQVTSFLEKVFPGAGIVQVGEFIKQTETIDELSYIIEAEADFIEKQMLTVEGFTFSEKNTESFRYKTSIGVAVRLYPSAKKDTARLSLRLNSSPAFYAELSAIENFNSIEAATEAGYFTSLGIPFIAAPARENPSVIALAKAGKIPELIQPSDIRGIIHSHSNWSDGSHTIEEMAMACIARGLEYLVISDHSKSAFYANGLNEDRIREQHAYVDALNEKLKPFKIFKSIESDILNDGSLDYANGILNSFDLVIASVHSNLKMTEEKAMMRLINAIENPYTTILGHPTGRLLLSRPGYPVDHRRIIDACAANKVVIELNAHPNRLDIDWRQIDYALEKGVLISIDPDAHHVDGLDDTRYGVWVAQKALVTKEQNLSSFTLANFEKYITSRKTDRLH